MVRSSYRASSDHSPMQYRFEPWQTQQAAHAAQLKPDEYRIPASPANDQCQLSSWSRSFSIRGYKRAGAAEACINGNPELRPAHWPAGWRQSEANKASRRTQRRPSTSVQQLHWQPIYWQQGGALALRGQPGNSRITCDVTVLDAHKMIGCTGWLNHDVFILSPNWQVYEETLSTRPLPQNFSYRLNEEILTVQANRSLCSQERDADCIFEPQSWM